VSVGFAVPSIPPRRALLERAVKSILGQSHPVDQISIAIDHIKAGAGPTRNRAKNAIETSWTCFLDDDDEVMPNHVQHLLYVADATGADVVAPWFQVIGGQDPFPALRGLEWNADTPHSFPITCLVRTELAQSIDFDDPMDESAGAAGEDFHWWAALGRAGAKVVTIPEATWIWHHDSHNTAGLPSRWSI